MTTKAIKNAFQENHNATVGFEFFTINIRTNNVVNRLQIWDTCGQEIYRSLITNFYRNSSLAVIVFALDNKESFENVDNWIKELKQISSPDIEIILIGNKNDVEEREVTIEMVDRTRANYEIEHYLETSAKTGFNAIETFILASKMLHLNSLKYKNTSILRERALSDASSNNVNLGSNGRQESGCSC